jgi:hypothetical protein
VKARWSSKYVAVDQIFEAIQVVWVEEPKYEHHAKDDQRNHFLSPLIIPTA